MAAAEARAAWQRTANRCFVQEDAKRAPKLACCPSSSSSSKPQVDTGSGDVASGTEHAAAGFMPLNWNPSNSNLPPDTKWWLQLQPNFGHQKEFTYEQLNLLEAELESLRSEEIKQTSKISAESQANLEDILHVEMDSNDGSSLDPLCRVSTTCMKNDLEVKRQVLKATKSTNTQETLQHKDMGEYRCRNEGLMGMQETLQHKDMGEYRCRNEGLMGMETDNQFTSKQPEKLFDMESPWMVGEKTEPWWRTADKDELASLVAQKSLEHIENCDLPPPQNMHVRRGPFTCLESLSQEEIFTPLDQKAPSGLCNSPDHSWGCLTCGSVNGKHWPFIDKGHSLYGSDNPFSTQSQSAYSKDLTETVSLSESETSKSQLMEALRHSQTRAREAEQAAQQAYNEKEHILKLFFRQASHLFAYKQWLQMLQPESICLQLNNKDQPISTFFPVVLPWAPYKGRQWKKEKHKTRKGKHSSSRYDIGRYVVAFAVGLGLAGAGLLLGWTMGWLFPIRKSG